MRDKLIAEGFSAYIQTSTGLYRVFVGPFSERAEANRLRERLSTEQRLDGFVVRLVPAND